MDQGNAQTALRTPHYALRTAFTLIELLVVIAIISLLVSILLPSLTKAKELARRTACAANLHSIALGSTMYAEEQAGRLPTAMPKWSSGAYDLEQMAESTALLLNQTLGQDNLVGPPGTLQDFSPDIAEQMIWRCPSHNVVPNNGMYTLYYYDSYGRYFFTNRDNPGGAGSYIMQTGLRNYSGGSVYCGSLSPTTTDDPIGPLVADALGTRWGDPSNFGIGGYHTGNNGSYNNVAGINQAWSDGHAEWDSIEEFPETAPVDGWKYTISTSGAPRFCWME